MAQHRAGISRLQKCHGCGKDFNAKDKQTHIMEIVRSLRQ
jgi:transposase-like protein